jgi:hypothetical protein
MITCINDTSSSAPRMPLLKTIRNNTSNEGIKIMKKSVQFAPAFNRLHNQFNHLSIRAIVSPSASRLCGSSKPSEYNSKQTLPGAIS